MMIIPYYLLRIYRSSAMQSGWRLGKLAFNRVIGCRLALSTAPFACMMFDQLFQQPLLHVWCSDQFFQQPLLHLWCSISSIHSPFCMYGVHSALSTAPFACMVFDRLFQQPLLHVWCWIGSFNSPFCMYDVWSALSTAPFACMVFRSALSTAPFAFMVFNWLYQ